MASVRVDLNASMTVQTTLQFIVYNSDASMATEDPENTELEGPVKQSIMSDKLWKLFRKNSPIWD